MWWLIKLKAQGVRAELERAPFYVPANRFDEGQCERHYAQTRFNKWAMSNVHKRHKCSGLLTPDTFLGENDRHTEVFDEQTSMHAVKGKTHSATLIVETFSGQHVLEMMLPWLEGKPLVKKEHQVTLLQHADQTLTSVAVLCAAALQVMQ